MHCPRRWVTTGQPALKTSAPLDNPPRIEDKVDGENRRAPERTEEPGTRSLATVKLSRCRPVLFKLKRGDKQNKQTPHVSEHLP